MSDHVKFAVRDSERISAVDDVSQSLQIPLQGTPGVGIGKQAG